MENFFINQIDYIYFIYGLNFIILGVISYFLFIANKNQLLWKWLALFGLMQGVKQWLDLLGLSIGDHKNFQIIGQLILIASFLCFSEVGRDEAQKIFGKVYGRWIFLPALLILPFGWSLNGVTGINVFSRYIFGFIGGLWASFAIYKKSKEDVAKSKNQDFLLLAIIIGLFALTQLIVPAAKIFPATFLNEKTFISSTGIPIQALRAIFIILAAFTIWFIIFKENTRIKYRAALVFFAALVLGWVLTENIALRYKKEFKKNFLIEADTAAAAVNPQRIRSLEGLPSDIKLADFKRLKEQLTQVNLANPDRRFVYLLGFKEGKTFFYVDAEPSGSPNYSPPGEILKKEPSELARCFLKGEKLVVGPYQDKWGRWITAFVPVKDFDTQQILAVLGIDISVGKMQAYIFEHRLLGVLFTLVIFVLLVSFFIIFQLKGITSIENNRQLYFLQQLLDAIPVSVFYRDVGGVYLGCNKTFEEFIGKPKKQIVGKSVYELFPKEISDVFRHADWKLLIRPFDKQVYETYFQRADGLMRYVVFSNAVYVDTSGDAAGVVGVIMDISERRKAEEALLLSESKFKTLFESSRDAIMLLLLDKGFISGNPATIEMFRCKNEKEFTSYGPADLSPEYQPDGAVSLVKAQQMMAIAMEKGSNYFEWVHKRLDGEEFFATVLLTRMELEGKMLLQATVRDITERKKAEDSIRQAAKEWQHTFDSITDFIFVMDTESRIIKANEAFVKAFGGNPDNILGKKCFEVVHKTDSRFPNCPFPHTLEAKEVNTIEVDDPGLGITLLVTTSPMLDAIGNIIGVVHIAKDISELKRVQKVIQETLDMKSQFISMASHELRTPLTAIKESINIVSEEADSVLNSEQKQFLGVAKRNLDRLSRLINDILSFQKLEAHKVDFSMQSYDINELIKEVKATMEPLAKQKGLEFSLTLTENLPHISFDKDNITQVLINLINNAIKFTDKGKITVSTEKGDNTIAVAVCDTGRGIKKEDLPKLFQQFQQVGSEHERKTGGTGLGLAISKQIISQHRGKIWAESEVGAGTKFIFLLPIQERRKRAPDA